MTSPAYFLLSLSLATIGSTGSQKKLTFNLAREEPYLWTDPLPLEVLAIELGVSRERVRQFEAQVIQNLKVAARKENARRETTLTPILGFEHANGWPHG